VNQTRNRGYPYPQCLPPYIKDVADAPAQLKALAEAVEADMADLESDLTDAAFPPAVLASNTGAQVRSSGDVLDLNTLDYGPSAMVDLVQNALVVQGNGLYIVTGTASATGSFTTNYLRLSVKRNGATLRSTTTKPGAAASQLHTTVATFAPLATGDLITMTYDTDDASMTWNTVRLGMARLVEI
jgi:hypothetical protein